MKIEIYGDRVTLIPESNAEMHQLEWVRSRVNQFNKKWTEDRQWDIQSLTLPLVPRNDN